MWQRLSNEKLNERIFQALQYNVDYKEQLVLGVPASHLDERVFPQEAMFLSDAPFLSTLVHNPNHIGVHTEGESESFFAGTQAIERELIQLCAEDIFKAKPNSVDGYVASGGTEANLQAVWIYRNYFMQEHNASLHEIALGCSADTHYSGVKAANVFQLKYISFAVHASNRKIDLTALEHQLHEVSQQGIKYMVLFMNMMTTMFGSVDELDEVLEVFNKFDIHLKVHIDAAYGGFYYPFVAENKLNFEHPAIHSITLDAHKMNQAPYGTGIFLVRKGWLKYTTTDHASYVQGNDATLCGSRSGANAVAVYMILKKYGFYGWQEKMQQLKERVDWFCSQLDNEHIPFYRERNSNIVVFQDAVISTDLAKRFGLVPDKHHQPNYWKIVVMDHVYKEKLALFLQQWEKGK